MQLANNLLYFRFILISLEDGTEMVALAPSGEILEKSDERISKIKWNTLNSRNHSSMHGVQECSVAAVSNSGTALATGDCQGSVKLYSYPPSKSALTVSFFLDYIYKSYL